MNLNIRIQTSVRVHRSRGGSIKGGKETKRYAHTLDSLNKQFDDFAAVLSKSSQFPSCFRHSFFFSFFRLSFLLFFTVISRRVFCFYSSLFASRNFESNRARESNGGLVAREIRELRVSTLNAENMFKKKKAYFRTFDSLSDYFKAKWFVPRNNEKYRMLRTRNYVYSSAIRIIITCRVKIIVNTMR